MADAFGPSPTTPALSIDVTIAGSPPVTTAPGIMLQSIADASGNPISSIGTRLAVHSRGSQDAAEDTVPSQAYLNASLSTTPALVKTGRTNLYYIEIVNTNAASAYVQAFDMVAAGQITLGTTPPTDVWFVPASGAFQDNFAIPMSYVYGLQLAATTTANGSTANTTPLLINLRTSP